MSAPLSNMSLVSLKITDGIKRILEEIKDDSLMESISGEIGEGKISIKSVKKVINHLKGCTISCVIVLLLSFNHVLSISKKQPAKTVT